MLYKFGQIAHVRASAAIGNQDARFDLGHPSSLAPALTGRHVYLGHAKGEGGGRRTRLPWRFILFNPTMASSGPPAHGLIHESGRLVQITAGGVSAPRHTTCRNQLIRGP
ncbi:hypothetical protein [Parafrankia sp. FMc2]|uniref:hypothetical protein n=1 Tax=Parafrankia sp. FMc2 TaxID=3233196 RepID=UPI0034D4EE0B